MPTNPIIAYCEAVRELANAERQNFEAGTHRPGTGPMDERVACRAMRLGQRDEAIRGLRRLAAPALRAGIEAGYQGETVEARLRASLEAAIALTCWETGLRPITEASDDRAEAQWAALHERLQSALAPVMNLAAALQLGERKKPPYALKRESAPTPISAPERSSDVRPRFEVWALAIEHGGGWHVFKRFDGKWRHHGRAKGIAKGRQEDLLKRFAEGGGFLSDVDAVNSVRGAFSTYDRKKIMQTIKPEISRLRKVIRRHLQVMDHRVDPLPRDKNARGWQARIQIGYAVKSDAGRLEFRLFEQLSSDETLDV